MDRISTAEPSTPRNVLREFPSCECERRGIFKVGGPGSGSERLARWPDVQTPWREATVLGAGYLTRSLVVNHDEIAFMRPVRVES